MNMVFKDIFKILAGFNLKHLAILDQTVSCPAANTLDALRTALDALRTALDMVRRTTRTNQTDGSFYSTVTQHLHIHITCLKHQVTHLET